MRWVAIAALALALAALVAVNALLLGTGAPRNDPVGTLDPRAVHPALPAAPTTTQPAVTVTGYDD